MVLFFVIVQVFPLYMALFPPNQAYAVFGVFLVFTFFLYLLGFVFVLGAELNAFLQEPARSAALAEATKKAHQGQASSTSRPARSRPRQRATRPPCAVVVRSARPRSRPPQMRDQAGERARRRG